MTILSNMTEFHDFHKFQTPAEILEIAAQISRHQRDIVKPERSPSLLDKLHKENKDEKD